MNKPYFTIITVCYNSAATIENTFKSLLKQEFRDFEYTVVDGASTDGTVDIIQKYQAIFAALGVSFTWTSEKDNGIYDAMNKGIQRANGQVIGIINSDDTYTANALSDMAKASREHPEVDVYHGIMRYLNQGKVVMVLGMGSDHLGRGMIEHPTCFVRREVYEKYGLFDCSYRFVADYDLMIRLKRAGCKFMLLETIIANFDENGAGNSNTSIKELLALKKKYHLCSNLSLMEQYAKYYIKRIRK